MLGLTKLFVSFFVGKYKAAAFRSLKLEDDRQRFVGVPSEYVRGLEPVFPKGTTYT